MSEEERHDDLIVDEGFAVLNNFKPTNDGNAATKDPIPRYPFASFANAISMPSESQKNAFLNDCSVVFTARTREDSESYSTGETFFLPCLMKPRCALEALAHTIFYAHVDGLEDETSNGDGKKKFLYDPERSGAEWWTLVLDSPSADENEAKQKDSDDEYDAEDDEVGMHFDADYGLESQMPNFLLHPRVATITYLSDIGVPTFILNKKSPAPSDVEKQSLGGDIDEAWLSHPKFGKHVAFDGRLLHGAPGEFFPAVAESTDDEPKTKKAKVEENCEKNKGNTLNGKRVTFLVNVWLNHCPIDAEILDDDVVAKLTAAWEDPSQKDFKVDESYSPPFQWNIKDVVSPDDLADAPKLMKASEKSGGPAGMEDELVICNRHITMHFGATMKDFHNASNIAAAGKGSARIEMGEGVLSLEVGNEASDEDDEEKEDVN